MEWLFIAGLAFGVPLTTPPLMRALGRSGNDSASRTGDLGTFTGFTLTAFGLAGLLALGFSAEPLLALVGSGAIGIACGALNPDLLGWLNHRGGSPAATDRDDTATLEPNNDRVEPQRRGIACGAMDEMMATTEIGERSISDEVAAIEARLEGYQPPAAFAVGVATVGPSGGVLDVRYPHVNLIGSWGTVAVLAEAVGYRSGTQTYKLDNAQIYGAIDALEDLAGGDGPHPNVEAWKACAGTAQRDALGGERVVVAAIIDNIYQSPIDEIDAYLRLHLLSHRKVRPHGINLNGIFGVLNNAVWTNHGPFEPEDFDIRRVALMAEGHDIHVHLVDKFPRMLDYVVPSGVRIADSNRVRLGAHLAEGTTVMHEGFCNFNAGTLGVAMVEGRISAGVIVGDHSDVGGGASIMGTLSGGGTEVISVGERCLIGANGGIGISLGDDCIVEAGCYITGGTRVTFPDGEVVKGRDVSGASGLLFRRNSETGQIQAIPRDGAAWEGLNAALHAN